MKVDDFAVRLAIPFTFTDVIVIEYRCFNPTSIWLLWIFLSCEFYGVMNETTRDCHTLISAFSDLTFQLHKTNIYVCFRLELLTAKWFQHMHSRPSFLSSHVSRNSSHFSNRFVLSKTFNCFCSFPDLKIQVTSQLLCLSHLVRSI